MILGQLSNQHSLSDPASKCVSICDPVSNPVSVCDQESRKSSSAFLPADTEKKLTKIKAVLIMRYLGTTPDSSALCPMLISLCQQV